MMFTLFASGILFGYAFTGQNSIPNPVFQEIVRDFDQILTPSIPVQQALAQTVISESIENYEDADKKDSEPLPNLTQNIEQKVHEAKPQAVVLPQKPQLTKIGENILKLKNGQNFKSLLIDYGISKKETHQIATAMKVIFDCRRLKSGQEIYIKKAANAQHVTHIRFRFDDLRDVWIRAYPNYFQARLENIPLKRNVRYIEGSVGSGLYQACKSKGLSGQSLHELIKAFRHRINIQYDVRSHDRFEVAYEEAVNDEGRTVALDKPFYASLSHKGQTTKIYRFAASSGLQDYFMQNGQYLRRAFMVMPVDNPDCSSEFGNRRHPVFNFTRFHKGVDYRAKRGSPVYSSADGVVVESGYRSGYGRYIRIRHNDKYETAYAHLNNIHVSKNMRVRQGQRIGAVGDSGVTTGCHLHYEVLYMGRQINPKSVKSFGEQVLIQQDLRRFEAHKRNLDLKLASLKKTKGFAHQQRSHTKQG
jgi:murein DD-endopeptidase MepM/ murein hydrolase activator NlpD